MMKFYLLLCVALATTWAHTLEKHPNHNYDPVEPDDTFEPDEHDDHEAQASDSYPSTIALAPHQHTPPQNPVSSHHPQSVHHLQELKNNRPQSPRPFQKPQNSLPQIEHNFQELRGPHHSQEALNHPPATPHTEALKSYYPRRKRYPNPPKHRRPYPYGGSKGQQKYPRRPQPPYQSIFSKRPPPKYPPRPGVHFGPRPSRPQGHRPPGPSPGSFSKPSSYFGSGGVGLGARPLGFGSVETNYPGSNSLATRYPGAEGGFVGHGGLGAATFGAVGHGGKSKPGFGSFGTHYPGAGGDFLGHGSLGAGHPGLQFDHKPAPAFELGDQGGFEPEKGSFDPDQGGFDPDQGAHNDVSEGSESHYVGTYEGGGGDKWKGGGEVAGRVKIKVFRGPTQTEHGKHFAPWGYFVSQPNDQMLGKKGKTHPYTSHY